MNFFKSVKKAFSKVGKIVKKIAPVLVVAAAVYFGGAYLMASAGGASAQVAASVGTSFTKSAGVWKSFLGGLSSGTASQSAVAFAEGSFKASQLGMSLSGQVAAGTSAVNFLSSGVSTSQAINQGVSLADQAFTTGSNVQSSWDILWNGLDKTVGSISAPADPASEAMGLMGKNTDFGAMSDASVPDQTGEIITGGNFANTAEASPADFSVNNEGLFGPQGTAMADATQLEAGQATTGSSVAGVAGSTTQLPSQAAVDPASVEPTRTPSMWDLILEERQRSNDLLQASIDLGKAEIEARTKADNWKLGLTASGLFLNAFGQYQQARSAEKQERNRFMTTPALEEAFKNAYSS